MLIRGERVLEDLETLRAFGAQGRGVVRPSLSPPDMEARRWLRERMAEAGLDAFIDGVGNVFGLSRAPGPALLAGSHSDTQPTGGWLDGALGVAYALEAARVVGEQPGARESGLDTVAWIDEEGSYLGCLGSRAFCGALAPEDVAGAVGPDGTPLADAFAAAGLPGPAQAHRCPEGRYAGYLEAHIEQGPWLEQHGNRLGVVTAIVGIRGAVVRFHGQQNHAGTTPMHLRRDAGRAFVAFAHELDRVFGGLAGERTVWTIGRVRFEPGAPSIIPGRAEATVQFRDPDEARLQAMDEALVELARRHSQEGPVGVEVVPARTPIRPTPMDPALSEALAAAAEEVAPGRWERMPSAAGHDPMVLASRLPCAMLFIPSIGGISHAFEEDSRAEDIVLGCEAFTRAVLSVLAGRTR